MTYTLGIVIVMLNMLIAQMGDSFDYVQEQADRSVARACRGTAEMFVMR